MELEGLTRDVLYKNEGKGVKKMSKRLIDGIIMGMAGGVRSHVSPSAFLGPGEGPDQDRLHFASFGRDGGQRKRYVSGDSALP